MNMIIIETKKLKGEIYAIEFSKNSRFIACSFVSGEVMIFNGRNHRKLLTFNEKSEKETFTQISFSPNSKKIICCSQNKTADVFDICKKKHIRSINDKNVHVNTAIYSPDGQCIVTGSYRTIDILNENSGVIIKTLKGHHWKVNCLKYFNKNNNYIASGSSDKTLKIWNVTEEKCLDTMIGHYGSILDISISEDDKYIVSCSSDNTIRLWDLNSRLCNKIFGKGDSGTIWNVIYLENNDILCCFINKVVILNEFMDKDVEILSKIKYDIFDISFNGKKIVCSCSNNDIKIFKLIYKFTCH